MAGPPRDAIWSSLDPAGLARGVRRAPADRGSLRWAGGAGGADGGRWVGREQAGVADAAEQTKRRLADANRDYEARFGYIFIVCATGKTADEMLALLEGRLRHDAGEELRVAAEEQRKITRLRLAKLVETEQVTTP